MENTKPLTPEEIEKQAILLMPGEHTPEDAADLYLKLRFLQSRVREATATVEACLVEWIETEGGIPVGEHTLLTRIAKTEKVRDPGRALLEALTRLDYDSDEIAKVLSTNALKPGACAQIIGQDFRDKHFKIETKTTLDQTKVKKALAMIENKYLKGKSDDAKPATS